MTDGRMGRSGEWDALELYAPLLASRRASVARKLSRAQGGLSGPGQVLTAARAKAAPSVFGDPAP